MVRKVVIISLILIGGIVGEAEASEIMMKSYTSSSSITKPAFYIQYHADGSEGFDIYDMWWSGIPPTPEPYLWTYSNPYGEELETDSRPENTPEVQFHLAVKGNISGTIDNLLKFLVTDANGLEHRIVQAYDVNEPNTIYPVAKDGSITEITLPDLVNPPEGVYATWRIATPPNLPGDIAGPNGVGELDGVVDIYDLKVIANEWLSETLVDENYNWSDVNYDRLTNFGDFSVIAGSWLKEE